MSMFDLSIPTAKKNSTRTALQHVHTPQQEIQFQSETWEKVWLAIANLKVASSPFTLGPSKRTTGIYLESWILNMVHASIHLLTLHTLKIYQPFPNKSFAYALAYKFSAAVLLLNRTHQTPIHGTSQWGAKSENSKDHSCPTQLCGRSFSWEHGYSVFFSLPPRKDHNAEQPSSSMFLLSFKKTSPCTFFPWGTGHTLTTPVPQNLGLLMKFPRLRNETSHVFCIWFQQQQQQQL